MGLDLINIERLDIEGDRTLPRDFEIDYEQRIMALLALSIRSDQFSSDRRAMRDRCLYVKKEYSYPCSLSYQLFVLSTPVRRIWR